MFYSPMHPAIITGDNVDFYIFICRRDGSWEIMYNIWDSLAKISHDLLVNNFTYIIFNGLAHVNYCCYMESVTKTFLWK